MFPIIFKYTEENQELIRNYRREMWRLVHNNEIFGSSRNFSFKSRCKFALRHPKLFLKGLRDYSMVLELIKAWYIWRQTPMNERRTSKYMFPKWYS